MNAATERVLAQHEAGDHSECCPAVCWWWQAIDAGAEHEHAGAR